VSAPGDGAAQPLFSPRVVLWMVLVGVVSFCAFIALTAYAPDLKSGQDGGAHALSKSAVGFAGVAKLEQLLGVRVLISRGAPPAMHGGSGLLLLTPSPSNDPKKVRAFRFGGMVLVVLPKWEAAEQPLHPGWVDKAGLLQADWVLRPLGERGAVIERRAGASSPRLTAARGAPIVDPAAVVQAGRIQSLQTISGSGLRPVLVDERGKAVLAMSRSAPLFVLSDPDLLNTAGLADLATARAGNAILDDLRSDGPLVFDVTLNGFGRGRSLLRLALEPPLLGVTLCLLAAAAMMGLHAAGRFGPTERTTRTLALGKRALADNSAALVRMARRERRMGAGYAALARDAAARAAGAPRDLDAGQLDALLDRLGAARGQPAFSELAANAVAAGSDAEMMAAAHRIYQWKKEMTRDGR
jgi:hypothetical protein